ncbi:hypothetical protein PT287_09695 [Lactobacillus sp. ESL0679]|uniref:hypothetical protein n=1 Tax=Lactobacillus sp. ESL0679 TaxID=2983209 RepID=UPI0023F6D8B0|nr:hypothetical protein [Lactobacillus sp. ESL0679]MDF7683770.1 hypothetical protein [Lactobacillus sp. ESL0679]
MSSFEIILICAFAAYLLMKLRDYTLAANRLKKDMFSEKSKKETLEVFNKKLRVLELELYKLQENKEKLEMQPVSHKIKKQLRKLNSQITKLQQTQEGYNSALTEYQALINSDKNNTKFRNTLRSYLNNKYHL